MSITAGGNLVSQFNSTVTLGKAGQARTEITDTAISMFDGQSTPRKRVAIDNAGVIAIGGASGADVAVNSTDEVVRVDSSGVKIFNDSNNFTFVSGSGMSVTAGGNIVGQFGSDVKLTGGTLTIQSTAGTTGDDRIVVGSANLEMYTNNAKVLDVVDGKLNIGPSAVAGTAVTGNVRVESGNVYLYGNATNTFTQISSAGMETTLAGTKTAIFGSTSVIGSGTAVTTTSTDDCIRIAAGTISIFEDDNNKVVLNSGTLTFTSATNVNAIFGATTVLGSDGAAVTTTSTDDCIRISDGVISIFESANSFVEVDANALKIVKGGHVSASFGTTTTIGPTSGSHIELTGAGLKLKKALTDDSVITTLDISEDGVNIGKSAVAPSSANTPNAVVGNISLHGAGVRIYGAATDDYVDVKSDGVDVVAAGTTQAAFGATTTIGTSNDKVTLSSSGVTLTEGGVDTIAMAGGAVTVGTVGNSKSRVEVTSDAVKIINRSSGGSDSTMIEFNSGGTITADEYIIEKTRLFGFGGDGTVDLQTNGNYTVSDGGNGAGTRVSSTSFTDANGTVDAMISDGGGSSAIFTMNQDLYFFDLTIASGITLNTNGNRLFVFGTLTNNGTIDNSGGAGGAGGNGTSNNSSATVSGGSAGAQAGGGTLSSGSVGRLGANATGTNDLEHKGGGAGGGSGATGGIVFIAARTLAGSGNCFAKGGAGGAGGAGADGHTSSGLSAAAGEGSAGGSGGAGATTTATTRINVVDPHIVTMMRDVMSFSETAPRLQVSGGSGGGGSGGSGATAAAGASTKNGSSGQGGGAATNAIVTSAGKAGGTGGAGSDANNGPGGGGGGGGGGNGGVILIITTTASNPWTNSVAGGAGGARGNPGDRSIGEVTYSAAEFGSAGTAGSAGKDIFIPV